MPQPVFDHPGSTYDRHSVDDLSGHLIRGCFALILLVFLTCPAQGETELVKDGGFEQSPSQWHAWHVHGEYMGTGQISTSEPRTGSKCFLVTGNASASYGAVGWLNQVIDVPSTVSSMCLSFWYKATTSETTVTEDALEVYLTDDLVEFFPDIGIAYLTDLPCKPTGEYVRYEMNIGVLPGERTMIEIIMWNDGPQNTTFRIDDVSIIANPDPEVISSPGTVTGEQTVYVNQTAGYSVPGATSSKGHPIQYSFSWGDGTKSAWSSSASASHAWAAAGTKAVQVTARCSLHNNATSQSPPKTVTVLHLVSDKPEIEIVPAALNLTCGALTISCAPNTGLKPRC